MLDEIIAMIEPPNNADGVRCFASPSGIGGNRAGEPGGRRRAVALVDD